MRTAIVIDDDNGNSDRGSVIHNRSSLGLEPAGNPTAALEVSSSEYLVVSVFFYALFSIQISNVVNRFILCLVVSPGHQFGEKSHGNELQTDKNQ